jgi:hypothetical protein
MKVIVIGAGIAGYGAYLAFNQNNAKDNLDFKFYANGLKINRNKYEYNLFPLFKFPKKSEFGFYFDSKSVENSSKSIRTSKTLGGLSDFWSCSSFPFSRKSINEKNLDSLLSAYKNISALIRSSGNANCTLNKYFPSFEYSEFIRSSNFLNIIANDNLDIPNQDIKFVIGNNRVLLSNINFQKCTYCGDCFKGCQVNTLMRPANEIPDSLISNFMVYKIVRFGNGWNLLDSNGEILDYADSLFLALGVVETIKLLIRSDLLEPDKVEIYDSNAVFFPILLRNTGLNQYENSFGFANKVMFIESKSIERFNNFILISPFNHFFTFSIFGKLIGNLLKKYLIKYFALATFYSSPSEANIFKFNNACEVFLYQDNTQKTISTFKIVAKLINRHAKRFKFIPIAIPFDSSSHYSSNLLVNKNSLLQSSIFDKNLMIIDGNLFPGRPESSPHSLSILTGSFQVVNDFLSGELSN